MARGGRAKKAEPADMEAVAEEAPPPPKRAAAKRGTKRTAAAAAEREEEEPKGEEAGPPPAAAGEAAAAAAAGPAPQPSEEEPAAKAAEAEVADQPAAAAAGTSADAGAEAAAAPPAKRRRAAAARPAAAAAAPSLFSPKTQPALDLFLFGTNSFGALGLGDPEAADDPDTRSQIPRPKLPAVEGVKFVQVACGGMHTVALSSEGDVYTWGVNDEGGLGRKTSGTCWEKEPDSAKGDSFVPARAELPAGVKALQVAAGDGFTFALGTDHCLYGCGHFKDEVGALSGFTPSVKVQGLFAVVWRPPSQRDRIKVLTCGARHAALLTQRGEVLTWGSGSQGQLGRVPHYHQDSEHQPTAQQLFEPTPVDFARALGSSPASDVACGAYSTFVIAKNGSVAAWGLNNRCGHASCFAGGRGGGAQWHACCHVGVGCMHMRKRFSPVCM